MDNSRADIMFVVRLVVAVFFMLYYHVISILNVVWELKLPDRYIDICLLSSGFGFVYIMPRAVERVWTMYKEYRDKERKDREDLIILRSKETNKTTY